MIKNVARALMSWKVWGMAALGFVIATVGLFYYAKTAYGIGAFGGRITSMALCPVQGSFAVTIGSPVGGTFMYVPGGTDLYAYYQIFRPGAWALGMSAPGGACQGINTDGIFDILSPSGILLSAGTSM